MAKAVRAFCLKVLPTMSLNYMNAAKNSPVSFGFGANWLRVDALRQRLAPQIPAAFKHFQCPDRFRVNWRRPTNGFFFAAACNIF